MRCIVLGGEKKRSGAERLRNYDKSLVLESGTIFV